MTKFDFDSVIGSFNWDGCEGCIFSPPEIGGCSVDKAEWARKLICDGDFLFCGARKTTGSDDNGLNPDTIRT